MSERRPTGMYIAVCDDQIEELEVLTHLLHV